MTDPDEREPPSLEDELLGPARADGADEADGADVAAPGPSAASPLPAPSPRREVRSEPLIRVPKELLWDRGRAIQRRELWLMGTGFLTFAFIDGVMMYAPLMGRAPTMMPQMVTLLVVAFGLGGLLIWQVRGSWRPVGIGMMIGWVFLTLISAGFLTGVSP